MRDFTKYIYVKWTVITESGDEFVCVCPQCPSYKSPKFYVNRYGPYFCHRCGFTGNLSSDKNIAEPTNEEWLDAFKRAVEGLKNPNPTETTYPASWALQWAIDGSYWGVERGLPESSIKKYMLGYNWETGNPVIPIFNHSGECLGITERTGGVPKYKHPPGLKLSQHLYGSHLIPEDTKQIYLTEGQVDCIRLDALGYPTVASYGCHLSDGQVDIMSGMGVIKCVIAYDADKAGFQGMISATKKLRSAGILPMYITYPPGVTEPDGLDENNIHNADIVLTINELINTF